MFPCWQLVPAQVCTTCLIHGARCTRGRAWRGVPKKMPSAASRLPTRSTALRVKVRLITKPARPHHRLEQQRDVLRSHRPGWAANRLRRDQRSLLRHCHHSPRTCNKTARERLRAESLFAIQARPRRSGGATGVRTNRVRLSDPRLRDQMTSQGTTNQRPLTPEGRPVPSSAFADAAVGHLQPSRGAERVHAVCEACGYWMSL